MTDLPIPGRGLHIIHHNARSIKKDTDLFKFYIKHSEVGLYTVSETWLNEDIPDNIMTVDGYTLLRVDRNRLNLNGDRMEGGVWLSILRMVSPTHKMAYSNIVFVLIIMKSSGSKLYYLTKLT